MTAASTAIVPYVERADALSIGGFTPYSGVDWPGKLVATVFAQGCPWQCTYCHNPALQDSRTTPAVAWADVRDRLRARRDLLDGVVFSGGEPTRQPALIGAAREVRELGFGVGLHTAGAYPGRLAAVLPLVDWVGIDIKATPETYAAVTGSEVAGDRAWLSLELVRDSGVDYEVRLTVDPTVHTREGIHDAVARIIRLSGRAPVLQEARPQGTNADYAAKLAGRGMYDVIGVDDLPDLTRR